MKLLRSLHAEAAEEFKLVLKAVPIQRVVNANIEEIREASRELAVQIGKDEKFRVTVDKRRSGLDRGAVILATADEIDRKIDLKNSDKILLIEIVGSVAGVSVIKKSDVFSAYREKIRML